jgi:hypothetical protein
MKFGNEFWLILSREYISPNLFAVLYKSNLRTDRTIRLRIKNLNYRLATLFGLYSELNSNCIMPTVAAKKKGRSCQGVKYVFYDHTSKASKRWYYSTFGA